MRAKQGCCRGWQGHTDFLSNVAVLAAKSRKPRLIIFARDHRRSQIFLAQPQVLSFFESLSRRITSPKKARDLPFFSHQAEYLKQEKVPDGLSPLSRTTHLHHTFGLQLASPKYDPGQIRLKPFFLPQFLFKLHVNANSCLFPLIVKRD
jgi:hypothetical protein